MFGITYKSIDIAEVINDLRCNEAGALSIFIGTVRSINRDKKVTHIIFETYPEMIAEKFKEMEKEVYKRWKITKMSIIHRIGKVKVGEVSVIVGIASMHRKEAFAASRFIIEYIKKDFPIWKKEFYEDDTHKWL